VDGTGTGMCTVEGFRIRIAEPSGSGINEQTGAVDMIEISCGEGN